MSTGAVVQDSSAAMKKFKNNLKILDAAFSDGTAGDETQWPRALVCTDSDIPFSEAGFSMLPGVDKDTKKVTINAHVVNILTPGFCKTPISFDGKRGCAPTSCPPLSLSLIHI